MEPEIRHGHMRDIMSMQTVFLKSIKTLCTDHYDQEQIEAWTSGVYHAVKWIDITTNQFLLVATLDEQIIGFCSLTNSGYLDMLYVHPDHPRQGIAATLYRHIENEAQRRGLHQLTSEVSITARPFFEKMGFGVQTLQTVNVNGVALTNYRMTKPL